MGVSEESCGVADCFYRFRETLDCRSDRDAWISASLLTVPASRLKTKGRRSWMPPPPFDLQLDMNFALQLPQLRSFRRLAMTAATTTMTAAARVSAAATGRMSAAAGSTMSTRWRATVIAAATGMSTCGSAVIAAAGGAMVSTAGCTVVSTTGSAVIAAAAMAVISAAVAAVVSTTVSPVAVISGRIPMVVPAIKAMSAPAVAVAPSAPRSDSVENAVVKIVRSPVAIGRARIGRVIVVAPLANRWRSTDADANRHLRFRRRHKRQGHNQRSC